MSLAYMELIVGPYFKYLLDKFQNFILRSLMCYSLFKVLATVCRAVNKDSNYFATEEQVLLLISQNLLTNSRKMVINVYNSPLLWLIHSRRWIKFIECCFFVTIRYNFASNS
jgi:hypothetical protein